MFDNVGMFVKNYCYDCQISYFQGEMSI